MCYYNCILGFYLIAFPSKNLFFSHPSSDSTLTVNMHWLLILFMKFHNLEKEIYMEWCQTVIYIVIFLIPCLTFKYLSSFTFYIFGWILPLVIKIWNIYLDLSIRTFFTPQQHGWTTKICLLLSVLSTVPCLCSRLHFCIRTDDLSLKNYIIIDWLSLTLSDRKCQVMATLNKSGKLTTQTSTLMYVFFLTSFSCSWNWFVSEFTRLITDLYR